MSMQLTTDRIEAIAQRSQELLVAERLFLQDAAELLGEVRQSLLAREFTSLDKVLRDMKFTPPTQLQVQQKELRNQLANVFEVTVDKVSLEHVEVFLNRYRNVSVRDEVRELRQLRRNVAMLNRSNLAVAAALSRVVDRYLQHATGTRSNTTYGRTGEIEIKNPLSRIEQSA